MASSPSRRHDIAVDGTSLYQIVLPNIRERTTVHAAGELQRYLQETTGARLAIRDESEAGDGPAFLVGPSARARRALGNDWPSGPSEDGLACRSVGDDIVLAGSNGRGQIYAVYEFLERYLDVRFLAWDCTVAPRRDVFEIPEVDIRYAPQFIYRENLYHGATPQTIAVRHRLNGPHHLLTDGVGGRWRIHPYVHSFAKLVPPEEHSVEHPEYFSLLNGKRVPASEDSQLCLANPEVVDRIVRRVFEWIEAHPDVKIFDVSQNDGAGPCECAACRAVVKEEGSQHGPILRTANAVADAIREEHPDVFIETLAYHYSTEPPRLTRPRDNVIIRLCHRGNFFKGFEATGPGPRFAETVEAWSAVAPRVFIWHYATNFGHFLAPNQNLNALAKDLKCYARHGIQGVMVQANSQSPGGELAELRQYLATRLMWDPSQDPMGLRREFCEGYYGSASGCVLEYLSLLDGMAEGDAGERIELTGYSKWDPIDSVTPEFVARGQEVLGEAHDAASGDAVTNHVDRLLLSLWYMQLNRPDLYGLPGRDAPGLLTRAREVMERNGVTRLAEARSPTELPDVPLWLERLENRANPLPQGVVFDLYEQVEFAEVHDSPEFRSFYLMRDGEPLRTIFQFPPEEGFGEGLYRFSLPETSEDQRLTLRFETGFARPTVDGARFAVAVDGEEVWNWEQQQLEPLPHAVDLTPWAGRTIALGLRLDCIGSTANDWAQWVHPRVYLECEGVSIP
jgi:Domain of unknown function (DUF4838)